VEEFLPVPNAFPSFSFQLLWLGGPRLSSLAPFFPFGAIVRGEWRDEERRNPTPAVGDQKVGTIVRQAVTTK